MRAIKYRGKKFNNEWVYGSLITDKSVNVIGEEFDVAFITGNLPYHEDSGEVWLKKMRRVKTYTIGQYIGWHDKNGQEIYEGDIIRDETEPTGNNELGVVVYDEQKAMFALLFKDKHNPINYGLYDCKQNELEIIGNIHDNPGLLNPKLSPSCLKK